MKILHRIIRALAVLLAVGTITYTCCCYSNNEFISKWRTIYIETALSTMTHQWLATELLPESVVEAVRQSNEQFNAENLQYESSMELGMIPTITLQDNTEIELDKETKARIEFMQTYTEIDFSTMPEDISYYKLAMIDIEDLGIKTVAGDPVYCIDTINKLLIVIIRDTNIEGKLAIIKDPRSVSLETCRYSYVGDRVVEIMNNNDGILAVNASGFADPNWHGAGNIPVGLVKSNGVEVQSRLTSTSWIVCGIDYTDTFRIGKSVNSDDLRDGVEFRPAIIVDGELVVKDSAGWGLQPRTVVGQNSRKDILLLTVDGRQVGYSVGATMEECGNILLKYDAVQAINMDGGSSTVMAYNTETITKSCSGNSNGRHVPNAWVVHGVEIDYTDNTHGVPKSSVEDVIEFEK